MAFFSIEVACCRFFLAESVKLQGKGRFKDENNNQIVALFETLGAKDVRKLSPSILSYFTGSLYLDAWERKWKLDVRGKILTQSGTSTVGCQENS